MLWNKNLFFKSQKINMCLLHLSVNIFWEHTVKNMLRIYLNARKHTGNILQSDMKRKGGERGTSCWQWPLVFKWYLDMRGRVWKIKGKKKWGGERLQCMTNKKKYACIRESIPPRPCETVVCVCLYLQPSVVCSRVVIPTQKKMVPMSWLVAHWSKPTHMASARRKGTAIVPLKHVK